jgi:hypothetical protein
MKKTFLAAVLGVMMIGSMAFAGSQDFTLVNSSGVEIHELYISPTSADEWQEDVLGVDTLADGQSVNITFSPDEEADYWDIKVTDGEGTAVIWQKLKLTDISKVTLTIEDGNPIANCE